MSIARSFDVNRPGTKPEDLKGGVVGGSLLRGRLRVGDELEIRPGMLVTHGGKPTWQHLDTRVTSLHAMGASLREAIPGGLVGVGTLLDPSLTKSDSLVGLVLGKRGGLPEVHHELELEVHLLERVVGLPKELEVKPLAAGELVMLNVGTAARVGAVSGCRGDRATVALKAPVCAERASRVAISRRIANKWRLIGYGVLG
jgi:translation initiation factor 2 subunit 3